MKKLFFMLMAAGALMSACKSPEPTPPPVNHGTITLDKSDITLTYLEKDTVTPTPSKEGAAKNKTYNCVSSDPSIASVEIITGSAIEITAKRIGESIITYRSNDGFVSATCKVTVESRSNLLNMTYYKLDATIATVKSSVSGEVLYDDAKAANALDSLVYKYDGKEKFIDRTVYLFEFGKLKHTLVILNEESGAQKEAVQYIEERYPVATNKTSIRVKYFDATVGNNFQYGTIVGVFTKPIENVTPYKLGVIFTTTVI